MQKLAETGYILCATSYRPPIEEQTTNSYRLEGGPIFYVDDALLHESWAQATSCLHRHRDLSGPDKNGIITVGTYRVRVIAHHLLMSYYICRQINGLGSWLFGVRWYISTWARHFYERLIQTAVIWGWASHAFEGQPYTWRNLHLVERLRRRS